MTPKEQQRAFAQRIQALDQKTVQKALRELRGLIEMIESLHLQASPCTQFNQKMFRLLGKRINNLAQYSWLDIPYTIHTCSAQQIRETFRSLKPNCIPFQTLHNRLNDLQTLEIEVSASRK